MEKEKKVSLIGNSILKYLKSLRFYFVPLGCFSLFVVLGLSIVIPYIYNQLISFGKDIASVIQTTATTFNYQETINYATNQISLLDWSNNPNALQMVTSQEYISSFVTNSLKAGFSNYEAVESQITNLFNQTVNNIISGLTFFIVCLFLGLIVGFLITKIQIRNLTAKRKIWKTLLIYFLDSLIEATVVSVVIYLMVLWKPSILISSVVFILLFALIALFEAYIVQGNKQIKLSQVLKVSTTFKLILSSILIYLIAIVISLIIVVLTNVVAGIYISIPFIEIAFIVNNLNAESYVKKLAEANS